MKVKHVTDYVDLVHEKFPELKREEISKIMIHGLRMYYYLNNKGADVLIACHRNFKFWMLTGKMFKKYENFFKYSLYKHSVKMRLLNMKTKIPWDGYYYFGMTDEMYRFYESQEDEEIKIFENILLFRLFDELKLHPQYKYYFKVKLPEYKGYKYFLENYETSCAELIQ